jgi:hypothetical protein
MNIDLWFPHNPVILIRQLAEKDLQRVINARSEFPLTNIEHSITN